MVNENQLGATQTIQFTAQSVGELHGAFLRRGGGPLFRKAFCLIPLATGWGCTAPSPPAIESPRMLSPARVELRSGRLFVSSQASDVPARSSCGRAMVEGNLR